LLYLAQRDSIKVYFGEESGLATYFTLDFKKPEPDQKLILIFEAVFISFNFITTASIVS
jgi:hypothetical protein